MSDLKNDAREFFEQAREKIAPIVESAKEAVNPVLQDVKEAVSPVLEDVKEAVNPVLEDVKEKGAPVVAKVKDAAEEAIDAVKDGAKKVEDFFSAPAPGLNVKNEFFSELEKEALAQKEAAKAKAEEMSRKLREMMEGKK